MTYAGDEMVGAPDPGHLVLVEQLLDEPLRLGVDLHEADVAGVDAEEQEGLVPLDLLVAEEEDQRDEGDGVEGAVPEEGPPGEVEDRLGEEGAHADDEEDVEDGGADDGADADVGLGDEDADDRREEFRRRPARRHERRAGNIGTNTELKKKKKFDF